MPEITINPKDAEALLYVLAEASIEFDNEGHLVSKSVIDEIRDQIREQVKPAIEEPQEWGSVIRARRVGYGSEDTTTLRWQRQNTRDSNDSWVSEPAGDLGVRYNSHWSHLTDVEVLRVGLEAPRTEPSRSEMDAYKQGVQQAISQVHGRLQLLLDEAITSERKNALEKAIQAAEELAP